MIIFHNFSFSPSLRFAQILVVLIWSFFYDSSKEDTSIAVYAMSQFSEVTFGGT
jgi:hypothetical protein